MTNIKAALRKAYRLGQQYWEQADSESYKKQDKAADTQKEFEKLVEDTSREQELAASSKLALDEWYKKTEWIRKANWFGPYLGMHRADAVHSYVTKLEQELAQLKGSTATQLTGEKLLRVKVLQALTVETETTIRGGCQVETLDGSQSFAVPLSQLVELTQLKGK